MKSPITFIPRSAALALLLALAPTLAVAQSDDFSHGDSLWTRQDPIYEASTVYGLGLGPQVTFSFPAGGGYRIQTAPSPDPVDLGPGRGGSFREDVSYEDNFSVAVDLLDWDDTTQLVASVMGRISNPGPGSTSGYLFGYSTPGPGQSEGVVGIYQVTDEANTPLAVSSFRLYPTNTYRLAFFGQGSDLEGRVYLLPNTNTPILTVSADDSTWSSGYSGLVQADQSAAMEAATDVTYGYYCATNFCICDQPQNITCLIGAAVTLTTSAIGTAPLSYQWTHCGTNLVDGGDVSGSATSSLTINSVTNTDVGPYAVIVTDATGRSATSVAGTVSLLNLTHGSPDISINWANGIPSGTAIYGTAYIGPDNASGEALHLTDAVGGEEGSLVIGDLDNGAVVQSFDAQFEALIGGTTTPGNSADGLSFNWATDLPAGPFGESGSATGLTVTFEVDSQNPTIPGPGVRVEYGGVIVAQTLLPLTFLETYPNFVPVDIRLAPGGGLTVTYGSTVLFNNLLIPGLAGGVAGASFGWGARTGAGNDNFWINNVSLTTNPRILNFSPRSGPAGVSFSFYGVLQCATNVNGPYTDLPQATSPYSFAFPAGAGQMFWRARSP